MSKYFDGELDGILKPRYEFRALHLIECAKNAVEAFAVASDIKERHANTLLRKYAKDKTWRSDALGFTPSAFVPFWHICLLHNPKRVLDMEFDSADEARKRGYRKIGDRIVLRQNMFGLFSSAKHSCSYVRFTDEVKTRFVYALIPVSYLQPSHVNKQANPIFFINEAQPKNRIDDVSQFTAERHAADIHPEELLACPNAYSGAPIVNSRGEVIQGNGRANALRIMFEHYPEQAKKYKEAVEKFISDEKETIHNVLWGKDDIASDICSFNEKLRINPISWKEKVLVRILVGDSDNCAISDEEAIRYGQYTDTQMTTGGRQKFNPMGVARQILANGEMAQMTRILFSSDDADDEMTLSDYLYDNGVDVISWLAQKKYITPAEAQTCYAGGGAGRTLSDEGREGLRGILSSVLFAGASDTLAQRFAMIPVKAQVAVLTTIDRDIKMPDDKKLVKDIQGAIEVCQILMRDKASGFSTARTFEAAKQAVRFWQRQSSIANDGTVFYPADRYGELSLALAACFKGMTQNGIRKVLNDMYDKMTGAGGGLFDEPDDFGRIMTKAEAAKTVLGVELENRQGLGRESEKEPNIMELENNPSRYRELRHLDDCDRRDANCIFNYYIEPLLKLDFSKLRESETKELEMAILSFARRLSQKNLEGKLRAAIATAKTMWVSLQPMLKKFRAKRRRAKNKNASPKN